MSDVSFLISGKLSKLIIFLLNFRSIFKIVFSIIIFFILFQTSAQRNFVRVDGNIKEEKEKLEGVSVTIFKNEQFITKAVTESNGKFRFQLDYDSDYLLEFSKPGFVTKKVSVNSEGVPPEDQEFGHEFGGWDLSLFRTVEGSDVSKFEKPFVKISYNPDINKFEYDVEYTLLVKEEFEQIQKDFEKNKKEEEKRKKEEAKAEEKSIAEAAAKQKSEEEAKQKAIKIAQEKMEKEERRKAREAEVKINEENKSKPPAKVVKSEENSNHNIVQTDKIFNVARRDTGQYKTKEEFLQALAKLYPQGMTEEVYMEGNVKITRRIIVEGNSGTEFKMSEHPWGGRFWFKNGTPINESIWNTETQVKK